MSRAADAGTSGSARDASRRSLERRTLRRDAALRRYRQRQNVRLRRGDHTRRARRRPRDRARSRDLADAANGAPLRSGVRRARRGAAFGALGARALRRVAGVPARRDRRRRRRSQRRLRAAARRASARRRRSRTNRRTNKTSFRAITPSPWRASACAARAACWCWAARRRRSRATPPRRAGKIGLDRTAAARDELPLPAVRVVDMAEEFEAGNRRDLQRAAGASAGASGSSAARRACCSSIGAAARASCLCRSCGSVPQCPRCSVSLAVASQRRAAALPLLRFSDGRSRAVVRACGSERFASSASAPKRWPKRCARLFPQARVMRMDSDYDDARRRSRAHPARRSKTTATCWSARRWSPRGSIIPTVTLAAVVAADIGLHVAGFSRRGTQLRADRAGLRPQRTRARRARRSCKRTRPTHPAIVFAAAQHDYAAFAARELRRTCGAGLSAGAAAGVSRRHRAQPRSNARAGGRARTRELLESVELARCWGRRLIRSRESTASGDFGSRSKRGKPACFGRRFAPAFCRRARRPRTRFAINVDP